MDSLLGYGNTLTDYLPVLFMYGALFIVMGYAHPTIELNFRKTFWVLYAGWAVGVFIGNYLFFLLGIMSFLPWLNNFLHTFVWIGFCLGFLYAGAHRNPIPEQFALFVIFSFIVKWGERTLLGTWELDHFVLVHGNLAYIVGWSLCDGLYPVLSMALLKPLSRVVDGLIVHE